MGRCMTAPVSVLMNAAATLRVTVLKTVPVIVIVIVGVSAAMIVIASARVT
jgi:hypothetical protein